MRKIGEIIVRYGIGEWFGKLLSEMPQNVISRYAKSALLSRPDLNCPSKTHNGIKTLCSKRGGVCSVRLYEKTNLDKSRPADKNLVTLCPQRFWEANLVFKEISRFLLGHEKPVLVKEVGFLIGEKNDDVGRIDSVLVVPNTKPLKWCAVEIQAVYFSGKKMDLEFNALIKQNSPDLPFPIAIRRPDFRSSGPKRLMPQLQIKVPTLRRWGKKMAVVVDSSFFKAMGKMGRTSDVSNADIIWFIMDYKIDRKKAKIFLSDIFFTTLEMAITGLTAGQPVTLAAFEEDIVKRVPNGIIVS